MYYKYKNLYYSLLIQQCLHHSENSVCIHFTAWHHRPISCPNQWNYPPEAWYWKCWTQARNLERDNEITTEDRHNRNQGSGKKE